MPLRHKHNALITLVLLTAAIIRIAGFVTTSPPGPEHDEVANWLIDKAILAGNHSIYFTEAYGHEAGFHYWQTLFVWLVGDNLLALRTPAALLGVLAVAVTYALNKRLFGRNVALLTTALIAVLFMPVFYSRLALRAVSLPVTAGLSACFLWDWLLTGVRSQKSEVRRLLIPNRSLLAAAVFAGLSSYTYLASRTLPIFFIGFIVYIAIFHRPLFKATWRDWLLFAAVYLLISLPLILFLQNPQNSEIRLGEVDGPMRALLAGDFRPVFQNSLAILGGFGFSGDPLWRQGIAFKPIYGPLFATLFYAGLLLSLWRIRDIRYGFILIWLAASTIPSIMTVDAPSTIRMILMLPIMGTFPIVVIETILAYVGFSLSSTPSTGKQGFVHSYPQLSTGKWQLSTRKMSFALKTILTMVILLFYGTDSMRNLWITWPNNSEVEFVWQQALTEVGQHIDDSHKQGAQNRPITHLSIAGWSPESMDDPTLELVLKNDTATRRHFGRVGEIQTLMIPNSPNGRYTIYRPNDLPFHPNLVTLLANEHQVTIKERFTVYQANQPADFDFTRVDGIFTNPATGNQLKFLGYRFIAPPGSATIELLSFWEVGDFPSPGDPDTKLFLHLVNSDGNLLAQHDGLDAPHRFWQMGDQIVQVHSLENVEQAAELRIGVYAGLPPWPRFVLPTEKDFAIIPLIPLK